MYDDDMLIIAQNKDLSTMTSVLQKGLDTILRWCSHNKLTVNKDKTKYMLISNKKDNLSEPLMIGECSLCKVTQYEYLGVIIDQDLKMVTQVDSMVKKANSKLGILAKIRRFITKDTAIRKNKTMIRPYLEYVDFVIESNTQERVQKLNQLQHKALRRIEYCYNPVQRET